MTQNFHFSVRPAAAAAARLAVAGGVGAGEGGSKTWAVRARTAQRVNSKIREIEIRA